MFGWIFVLWVLTVGAEEPTMVEETVTVTSAVPSSITTLVVNDSTTTTIITSSVVTNFPVTNSTTVSPNTGTAVNNQVPSSSSISSRTTRSTVQTFDALKGLSHGVRSGKIISMGQKTLEVPNFHFDGTAPSTFFMVGNGDKITSKGTFIYLDESKAPLKPYNGESVKLILPNNLTVDTIDWLAVWCVKYQQKLGYVFIHKEPSSYPPQTFNLHGEVTSDFVVLVDKKTLYVPNFRYGGGHDNVRFWVGNGTPSENGVAIPDETGSTVNLRLYQGENLYLNLPKNLSTDNIDYFGVWSLDEKKDLGHVPISGIKGVPEAKVQKARGLLGGVNVNDNMTLRLPKCCSFDSVLTVKGCEERGSILPFSPQFKVFEHNATHFLNESLDVSLIHFEPYVSSPNCGERGKYPLDQDNEEFAILRNSSLLIKGAFLTGILPTDKFCLEHVEEDNETLEMRILVCVPEHQIQKAMFITYVIFTIVSTFCFAITFFLYCFWLKVTDVHKRCFTGYAFTMFMTFLILTVVQTANVENKACEVLGFFFQIFMIASFTLLGILCFDIWIIIKYIDDHVMDVKRKWGYLGVALGVPILSLIISLSRNLTPDVPNSFFKPQYLKNSCYFEAESQRTIYFYVPIGISIIVSIVFLVLTKFRVVHNDSHVDNDYYWIAGGKTYKFMWRKHLIILVTSLMWCLETVVHLSFANSNMLIAIDLVEASQGILVFFLFVVNKETRAEIVRQIKIRSRRRPKQPIITEEELTMLT